MLAPPERLLARTGRVIMRTPAGLQDLLLNPWRRLTLYNCPSLEERARRDLPPASSLLAQTIETDGVIPEDLLYGLLGKPRFKLDDLFDDVRLVVGMRIVRRKEQIILADVLDRVMEIGLIRLAGDKALAAEVFRGLPLDVVVDLPSEVAIL
jgi:hypothetical protein